MTSSARWNLCVSHRGQEVEEFARAYFPSSARRVLLVAGAGFDPRSADICKLVASSMDGDACAGLFLREERPNPAEALVQAAERMVAEMRGQIPASQVEEVGIFASDGAIVGGRAVVKILQGIDIAAYSDVVIDLSALSVGLSFPVVRYLLQESDSRSGAPNIHVMVSDIRWPDGAVSTIASDRATTVQGFRGGWGLESQRGAARLWLPQLNIGKRPILELIHQVTNPDDVCPILPFPASDPRLPDLLIEHFASEFESVWEVDQRNLVLADERNPLDLYRSILRIADARQRVFRDVGGSVVVLSPLGSKALALGSLMAAIDRDFPVVYVEATAYNADPSILQDHTTGARPELVHVWLAGDAYHGNETDHAPV